MGVYGARRTLRTALPADGVFRFRARLVAEGTKVGLRVTVPASVIRGLEHLGASPGCLVRASVAGAAFEGYLRRVNPRQVVLAVPLTARPQPAAGTKVEVEVTGRAGEDADEEGV